MVAISSLRRLAALCVAFCCALLSAGPVHAQEPKPVRIGFVTFLSGPAAGPFGVPARIAAEAIVESLNAGKAPAPYNTRGFGGAPLELVVIDEAGGTTKQVSEFRNLIERQNVDFVIGYISSGDCLAVAPVAEEMKRLTVLFDCGTPRVFEERSYKYVFRTRPHATMDAVAAALYLQEFVGPGISWAHFDVMAWNGRSRPGRPEGAEPQTLRALYSHIAGRFAA